MSAFLVEEEHITELVKAYFRKAGSPHFYNMAKGEEIKFDLEKFDIKTAVAISLARGNFDSLNARYKDYGREEEVNYLLGVSQIMRNLKQKTLTYPELINMCRCLEYQSCETADYYQSNAFHILEKLKDHFVSKWCDAEIDEDTQVTWSYPK